MSSYRAATLALAAAAMALATSTVVTSPAEAAPAKLWVKGSTIYAQATNMPPGSKLCRLHVPPAPYDIVGIYIGSQMGHNAERRTNASAITLSVGGLTPAPYAVTFECRRSGDMSRVAGAQRTLWIG